MKSLLARAVLGLFPHDGALGRQCSNHVARVRVSAGQA